MKGLKTLRRNPNGHTEYGARTLTDSFHQNGFSDPLVAAADGTILAGNLRAELAADIFQGEPIIIKSDGTRPVVHIRTDIAGEDDPVAQRIILASNRVAELDFSPDAEILSEMLDRLQADGGLKGTGYTAVDLSELLANLQPPNFDELDQQAADLAGLEDTTISLTVPKKYADQIKDWLANGERLTAPGLGKGVMRRAGLLGAPAAEPGLADVPADFPPGRPGRGDE